MLLVVVDSSVFEFHITFSIDSSRSKHGVQEGTGDKNRCIMH
jgi:hypothetical protein